jgi:serine/threonine-protein kinase RsbW
MQDTAIDCVDLNIPNSAEFVGVVRLAVSGLAARMKFSIEDIEDIKIAVSEACTNAVQYAYEQGIKNIVNIKCFIHKEKLEINVIDKGKGFDVEKIGKAPAESDNDIPNLGLGITFIKSLMNETEFISKKGSGTTVKMVKYLPKD